MTHRMYYARYTAYSKFYVPVHMNLHDESIVESYYTKWNTLNLTLTNGEEVEIEGHMCEIDTKHPDNCRTMYDTCELVKNVREKDDGSTTHDDVDCELYENGKKIDLDMRKWFEIKNRVEV